jgi:hypothetical protein
MQALVMMLKNLSTNTFHPIMYFESPPSGNEKLIKYKSKGHRTNGFSDRQQAIDSIDTEIAGKLKEMGYHLNKELDVDVEWNGEGIPADIQIRPRN